jgi:hypothetical protein
MRFFVSYFINYIPDLNVRALCILVLLCSGIPSESSDTPHRNIGAQRVSAKKQLTMPPQKRSKKNIPAETDQEEHHHVEGNGISLTTEPSNITDQERRAKLEALLKARA